MYTITEVSIVSAAKMTSYEAGFLIELVSCLVKNDLILNKPFARGSAFSTKTRIIRRLTEEARRPKVVSGIVPVA